LQLALIPPNDWTLYPHTAAAAAGS